MVSSEVQRTLVKSPPELWAELSDPAALARHLGELGDIRIVRSEPESTVEWATDSTSGTVSIKPSGWGTHVKLSVTRELSTPTHRAPEESPDADLPQPEPATSVDPEPPRSVAPALAQTAEADPVPRRGLLARLLGWRRARQASDPPQPPVEATVPVDATADPREDAPKQLETLSSELSAAEEAAAAEEVTAVLTAALDRLGAAHHRPFSRA